VGTDRVWNYATGYGLPKMIVVNALDKENVDFDAVLKAAQEHFGRHVFPVNVPINSGPGFNKVLDVLRSEIVTYATDGSGKYTEEPATGEWEAKVKELHGQLIEHIAESDDTLMEKFFEKGNLSEEEFRAGIHAAVQKELFIPLFAVSAENNIGVARFMDFVAKYGSSPVDRKNVKAVDANGNETEVTLDSSETAVYIFKTMSEAHFGELSFFRVYSGSITTGKDLFNSDRKVSERIGQIYQLNGQTRVAVPTLGAGDIGATVKLKVTHTGDTLCTPKHPVTLSKVVYPKPNIHASLVAKVKGEEDKIASGLAALHGEDPTFLYVVDSELHQTIISAQGELHLEVVADRLRRRHNVHVELAEPRVKYRETIKAKGDAKHRHKNKPVARDNSPRSGCASNPNRAMPVWSSPTRSSDRTWTAVLCRPSRRV
jgi:elongation factor G